MPSKAQKKRKINKGKYQKRADQDLRSSSSSTPVRKRPRLSATEDPASNQPSTSSNPNVYTPIAKDRRLSGVECLDFSSSDKSENETSPDNSDRSENESSSEQSGSNVSIDKGKRRKRKSNKHNGRKRKNVVQQSDSNDESEAESSSDNSDSDESLPENEEFPVVLPADSAQLAGKN